MAGHPSIDSVPRPEALPRHWAGKACVVAAAASIGLVTAIASHRLQRNGVDDSTAFVVVVPIVTLLLGVLYRGARLRGLGVRATVTAIACGLVAGTLVQASLGQSPHREAARSPIRVDIETLRRVG
ncbi:hypothetical protein BH10PSE17_BH10PSE17_33880 [soil metagenome]